MRNNWTLNVRTRTDLIHTRQETRQTFFIQEESMTVYPRGKFATVEQLQLSVLKRGTKVSAFTNKKHYMPSGKKRLEHFLRTEETYFLKMGNDLHVLFKATKQNNLFEITQDSPTFLRHPINPHLY